MVRILIVEDDTVKLGHAISAALEIDGVEREDIRECRDAATAKRLLKTENFDLLVLDITIPERLGEDTKRETGFTLLEEICIRRDQYRRPHHVTLLTAYTDLAAEVNNRFPRERWNVINYDLTTDAWRSQLQAKIRHILAAKEADAGAEHRFGSGLCVLCALDDPELRSVLNLPWSWEVLALPFDDTIYYRGRVEKANVGFPVFAAACSGMGMPPTVALAMKMIAAFRPKYIAMTGITAGVAGKVNVGDVLIADTSWDYGAGKAEIIDGEARFSIAPFQLQLDPSIRGKIRVLKQDEARKSAIRSKWPGPRPTTALELHLGPVASGAAVLSDPEIVRDVKTQQRKLIGVDMETLGVFAAAVEASHPKPRALSIKGAKATIFRATPHSRALRY